MLNAMQKEESQSSMKCFLVMTKFQHDNNAQICNTELQEDKPELKALSEEFSDIFDVPCSLPPNRNMDHQIPLKPGTEPINVRPYRYLNIQKDVLEQMVKELLDSGVIRHSTSPFSSPVVLVKKKDGSWRMCVDFKELNKATVKDKFPMPVIEELLDELYGAQYFSKLDLRSGYHKIKMAEADVYKTSFGTHQGHYEF